MPASPTYSYYIKQSGASDYGEAKYTGTDTSYTFNNLSQGSYDIQVKVKDKAENEGTGSLEGVSTKEVTGATGDLKEGAIIASKPTWDSTSHTASITLSKGADVASNLNIEWQINKIEEGSWTTGTNVTGLNHNDTVYARLTDGINHGQEASVTIKDEIAPNAPTISISSGTLGNNSYYKSNVTVTITAYTLDKAGNVSTASTQTINKDSTAPSTASLTVGTVGETSIAVTASGLDATSGVYSYEFQRSTTSSTSGFTTAATQTSTATSLSYTYSGLTAGTTYYLRVVVTDKAGNTRTGTAVTQATTKKLATNVNELEEGDWVNYVDKNGTTRKCIVLYDSSSSYGIQIITDDTVEDVTLGSNTFNTSMNSYNNAISTLNTRAEAYLNTIYASDARSVGSVPNNKNSQSGYYTFTQFTSSYSGKLRDTDTNYTTDYDQMEALGIKSSDKTYWLASCYVYSASSYSTFNVRFVYASGGLNDDLLCTVYNAGGVLSYSHSRGLRPCFTLKSGIKVTGGSGTESSPYTLGT